MEDKPSTSPSFPSSIINSPSRFLPHQSFHASYFERLQRRQTALFPHEPFFTPPPGFKGPFGALGGFRRDYDSRSTTSSLPHHHQLHHPYLPYRHLHHLPEKCDIVPCYSPSQMEMAVTTPSSSSSTSHVNPVASSLPSSRGTTCTSPGLKDGFYQSSSSHRSKTKICGVCGDRAKSYHFGGISCDSCKAFFRRSVQNDAYKNFHCPYEGQCDINITSRKCCQFCRFKKCLSIGMEKSWVMTEEERLQMLKSRLEKRQKQEQSDSNDSGRPPHQFTSNDPSAITTNLTSENPSLTSSPPSAIPEKESKSVKTLKRLRWQYQPKLEDLHVYLTDEEVRTIEDIINQYIKICREIPLDSSFSHGSDEKDGFEEDSRREVEDKRTGGDSLSSEEDKEKNEDESMRMKDVEMDTSRGKKERSKGRGNESEKSINDLPEGRKDSPHHPSLLSFDSNLRNQHKFPAKNFSQGNHNNTIDEHAKSDTHLEVAKDQDDRSVREMTGTSGERMSGSNCLNVPSSASSLDSPRISSSSSPPSSTTSPTSPSLSPSRREGEGSLPSCLGVDDGGRNNNNCPINSHKQHQASHDEPHHHQLETKERILRVLLTCIQQFTHFSLSLPTFTSLCLEDQVNLLKSSVLEVCLLKSGVHLDLTNEAWSGRPNSKLFFSPSSQVDDLNKMTKRFRMSESSDTSSSLFSSTMSTSPSSGWNENETSTGETRKTIKSSGKRGNDDDDRDEDYGEDKSKKYILFVSDLKSILPRHLFDKYLTFVKSIHSLEVDEVSLTLLSLILLFNPDRSGLRDASIISLHQEKLVLLLKSYMGWRFGREISRILFGKTFLRLPELREVSDSLTDLSLDGSLSHVEAMSIQDKISKCPVVSSSASTTASHNNHKYHQKYRAWTIKELASISERKVSSETFLSSSSSSDPSAHHPTASILTVSSSHSHSPSLSPSHSASLEMMRDDEDDASRSSSSTSSSPSAADMNHQFITSSPGECPMIEENKKHLSDENKLIC